MELISTLFDLFMHLDRYLDLMIRSFGIWSYVILFLVIFCETGLVVTPFLPGDSLLFAVGAFAALGSFDLAVILGLLIAAAILGDNTNYWIGRKIGPKVFNYDNSRIFNKKQLLRTHGFYERHGGKTVIIARFMPIIRTFAPFVAGVGSMTYRRFLSFDIPGGVLWISTFVLGGYFFGNIPMVKRNFTIVVMTIIVISVMPAIIGFLRERAKAKAPSL